MQPAEVNYLFTDAAYMENRDPEWRTEGLQGGCLLFDGNSNYVGYERCGRLCFQVGTGGEWLTLRAEDGNLNKYEARTWYPGGLSRKPSRPRRLPSFLTAYGPAARRVPAVQKRYSLPPAGITMV